MSNVPFNPRDILQKIRSKAFTNGADDINKKHSPTRFTEKQTHVPVKNENGHGERKSEDDAIAMDEAHAIRLELERDLHRLQQELKNVKQENSKFKIELKHKDKEFAEFKLKSEETIVQLRGKLASVALGVTDPVSNGLSSSQSNHLHKSLQGKYYGIQSPPATNARNRTNFHISSDNRISSGCKNWSSLNSKGQSSYDNPAAGNEGRPGEGFESFRDPTFNELMRRTTTEHYDYVGSLRKPGLFSKKNAVSQNRPTSSARQVMFEGNVVEEVAYEYAPDVQYSDEVYGSTGQTNHGDYYGNAPAMQPGQSRMGLDDLSASNGNTKPRSFTTDEHAPTSPGFPSPQQIHKKRISTTNQAPPPIPSPESKAGGLSTNYGNSMGLAPAYHPYTQYGHEYNDNDYNEDVLEIDLSNYADDNDQLTEMYA